MKETVRERERKKERKEREREREREREMRRGRLHILKSERYQEDYIYIIV